MENIITVSGLKKSYGDIDAVKGISLNVGKGQFFCGLYVGTDPGNPACWAMLYPGFRRLVALYRKRKLLT